MKNHLLTDMLYVIISEKQANVTTKEHDGIKYGQHQPSLLQIITSRKLHNHNSGSQNSNVVPNDDRTFLFSINPYNACAKNSSVSGNELWDMVILVVSGVRNFMRRDAIRNTWGSNVDVKNVKVLFLVGVDRVTSFRVEVAKESQLYGDIIQVDIGDNYTNLTSKSIAMLQWINDYCSNLKYLMKADDDVFVNLNLLLPLLHNFAKSEASLLCHVFQNAPPDRNKNSKYYTPIEEYPERFFPTYCSGVAYIIKSNVVAELHKASLQAKYLTMEDVFLTGIVANQIGISLLHEGRILFYKTKATGCSFRNTLVAHQMSSKELFVIYSQMQTKEIDCDTNINKYLMHVENMS